MPLPSFVSIRHSLPSRPVQTNSLPRPAKSRLPSVVESSETPPSLDGGDRDTEEDRTAGVPGEGEKPPLPPKPSPPHSFTSMITARPFRKSIAAPAVQRPCSVQSLQEKNSCIQYIY